MEEVKDVSYWVSHLDPKPKLMVTVTTIEENGPNAGIEIEYEGEVCDLLAINRHEA